MAQSLARILVHIVFSTKKHVPLIRPDIETELHAYMATVFRECESPILIIGGATDHLHALCSLSKNWAIADLLKEVKRSTSKWIKTKGETYADFYWQGGYGAFSIGESGLSDCKQYIARQKEHHRRISFQDELRALLRKYHVPYDERYVWD